MVAIPMGAPHRRRVVHAARSGRSRRSDSEKLSIAVPPQLSDHGMVWRQDGLTRRTYTGARRRPPDGHNQHRWPESVARGDARTSRELGSRDRNVSAASKHQTLELPNGRWHDPDGEKRNESRRDARRNPKDHSGFQAFGTAFERRS